MTIQIDTIIGIAIVILNLIPFIIKKTNLLFLTALVSLIILFLLQFL